MTPSSSMAGCDSPSLMVPGVRTPPAFELKFLLPEEQAFAVEDWARARLSLDPHGDPAMAGAYRTTSLYCDTLELDVFHRSPQYKRRKFRARKYGSGTTIFLERKSKWGDRVSKRRCVVPEDELPMLVQPLSVTTWSGHWFHQRITALRLRPACRITYLRTAYLRPDERTPMRLTFDRGVRGVLANDWRLGSVIGGLPLLTGQVIFEMKFRESMPALFKQLVNDFRLTPTAVSKYRLCREAWGAAGRREAADA